MGEQTAMLPVSQHLKEWEIKVYMHKAKLVSFDTTVASEGDCNTGV